MVRIVLMKQNMSKLLCWNCCVDSNQFHQGGLELELHKEEMYLFLLLRVQLQCNVDELGGKSTEAIAKLDLSSLSSRSLRVKQELLARKCTKRRFDI